MRPDYVLRLDKQMYRFEQQEDTLDLAKRGSAVRGGNKTTKKKKGFLWEGEVETVREDDKLSSWN